MPADPPDSPEYDDIPTQPCPRCGKDMEYSRDGWYCHEKPTAEDLANGDYGGDALTAECVGSITDDGGDGPDPDEAYERMRDDRKGRNW